MNWMIVVPVAIAAGCFGAWLRSLEFDREQRIDLELGPVFAGIVFAGLAVAFCFVVTTISQGVSISVAMIVVFGTLLVIAALLTVFGAMMGSFLATAMGATLVALCAFMCFGDSRVEALESESASFAPEAQTRVFDIDCDSHSATLVAVGRETDGGFEVQGWRYRVAAEEGPGVAEFYIETAGGSRYATTVAKENNLVANGQWQSRRAAGGGVLSNEAQLSLLFTARFAGHNPGECQLPVAF